MLKAKPELIEHEFNLSQLHYPEYIAVNKGSNEETGEEHVLILYKCRDCGERHCLALDTEAAEMIANSIFLNITKAKGGIQ